MKRELKFFDILCIGVNAIIGSGIFLIPGRLIGGMGPASILLFVACGLMLIPIGLCFAEASSRTDRNGGPYVYVRTAFGNGLGFATGWIDVATALFSYPAAAIGLPYYLATFAPVLGQGIYPHLLSGFVIIFLAAINIRGIRLGATTINIFTIGKMVPLFILIGVGIYFFKPAAFTPFAPHGFSSSSGLILAVLFMYQGFEVAPVPAGETKNPQRVVPRAVVLSILVSIIIYLLVHTMLIGSGANLAGSEAPLADALSHLIGPKGAMIVSLGAVVSMFGYCAGLALGTPRYITVLCEDGFLPKIGAKQHKRYGTPYVAIIFFSVTTYLLTLVLNFDKLVDIAATVIVMQYFLTCLAIPILRKKVPKNGNTYTSPLGLLFPFLGVLTSLIFITQIRWPELKWAGVTLLIGFVFSGVYCALKKKNLTSRP